jgi:hypothetical protein
MTCVSYPAHISNPSWEIAMAQETKNAAVMVETANKVAVYEKLGTERDERDMDRMGKVQVLRVSERVWELCLAMHPGEHVNC